MADPRDNIPPPSETFSVREYLEGHPFFVGLPSALLDLMEPMAKEVRVEPQHRVFRQDAEANQLFIVLDGEVQVEVPAILGEPAMLQQLGPGSILGWSWLIPPHRWHFDARALKPTRLLELDGKRLREECRKDPALGYPVLERTAVLMMERLQAARQRVIDTYTG